MRVAALPKLQSEVEIDMNTNQIETPLRDLYPEMSANRKYLDLTIEQCDPADDHLRNLIIRDLSGEPYAGDELRRRAADRSSLMVLRFARGFMKDGDLLCAALAWGALARPEFEADAVATIKGVL
jgi:hypothetical protein